MREDRIRLQFLFPMPASSITRTEIHIDDRPQALVVRVNRRAKHLILKVDPYVGEIQVTAPSKRAVPEAIAFARERADWIASQLGQPPLGLGRRIGRRRQQRRQLLEQQVAGRRLVLG